MSKIINVNETLKLVIDKINKRPWAYYLDVKKLNEKEKTQDFMKKLCDFMNIKPVYSEDENVNNVEPLLVGDILKN